MCYNIFFSHATVSSSTPQPIYCQNRGAKSFQGHIHPSSAELPIKNATRSRTGRNRVRSRADDNSARTLQIHTPYTPANPRAQPMASNHAPSCLQTCGRRWSQGWQIFWHRQLDCGGLGTVPRSIRLDSAVIHLPRGRVSSNLLLHLRQRAFAC